MGVISEGNALTVDEARAVVVGERESRRAMLRAVVERNPGGRLARKAEVLLLDLTVLEDRIAEAGGEEELVFLICAQVASGCTLSEWCKHYCIERGLVWAFLTEKEERIARYYRALEGVADEYYGESVGIADGSDADKVAVDKLRIDTRMKVASKYANGRFGDKPVGVAVQNNITIVHESQ